MKVVRLVMSNKIFTEKELEILTQNKYVKKISVKGITYTEEFKRIFIIEYERGKIPRTIFEEYGFEPNILGIERINSSGKRWRKSYKEKGVLGLNDTRKENTGRPRIRELSTKEKLDRLKVENKLLKAENELLKKIDIMERRLIKKK